MSSSQDFSNHRRIAKGLYIYTGLPTLAFFILAVKRLFTGHSDTELTLMLILAGWVLLTYLFRVRSFALIAQDRAIRAEEGLRYFQLTGKRMDTRITISQVIALRFASDEELPSLTQRALDEQLTNKQIKAAIKHWRSDWHRV